MRTILCKDLSHNQARKSYSLFSMALEPPALGANGIRINGEAASRFIGPNLFVGKSEAPEPDRHTAKAYLAL